MKLYSIIAAVVWFCFPPSVKSQINTGVIQGVVRDVTGGVLPETLIIARHLGIGITRTCRVSAKGFFTFVLLPVGTYEITAHRARFADVRITDITVNIGQTRSLEDITDGKRCSSAYRLAIENALSVAGLTINPKASCQIGICIVGIEERETEQTLSGIMIEAFLRNSTLRKSFFIRYGAGSPRGLTPAIRLSAEMLIAELQGKRIVQNKKSKAQYPTVSTPGK